MRCSCVTSLRLASWVYFSIRVTMQTLTTANQRRTKIRFLSPTSMWRDGETPHPRIEPQLEDLRIYGLAGERSGL